MPLESVGSDPVTVITRYQAREKGLKRYCTGFACRRGHIDERQVSNGTCIACAAIQKAAAYRKNPARERTRVKKHRDDHKAEYSARRRKAWAASPVDVRRAIRSKALAKVVTDPEKIIRYKVIQKVSRAARRARENNALGRYTAGDVVRILQLQRHRCSGCMASLDASFHADHIMPLARGGTNWPSNIQILCSDCNARKGAKRPETWALELGRLL